MKFFNKTTAAIYAAVFVFIFGYEHPALLGYVGAGTLIYGTVAVFLVEVVFAVTRLIKNTRKV